MCFCLYLTLLSSEGSYQSTKKGKKIQKSKHQPPPHPSIPNPPQCVNSFLFLFSNVYLQVKAISNIVWKYQRYHFIMAYHEKPVLPPPLIVLSHIASLFCCICKRRKTDKTSDGPSMNCYCPKNCSNLFDMIKTNCQKSAVMLVIMYVLKKVEVGVNFPCF